MSKYYYSKALPALLLAIGLIALQPAASNAAENHATTLITPGSHQLDERTAKSQTSDLRTASEHQATNSYSADHHASADAPDRTAHHGN
jgi:hypothetical protein